MYAMIIGKTGTVLTIKNYLFLQKIQITKKSIKHISFRYEIKSEIGKS